MITFQALGRCGRLGNQMFQIASTIGIAIKNNEEYRFENFEYNHYLANPIPIGKTEVRNFYHEPYFHHQEVLIEDCNLHGYFQSEKYFSHCKQVIRSHFTPKKELLDSINRKYSGVIDEVSASIHVRRGDYLQLERYHPVLMTQYYYSAIKILGQENSFLICTDDLSWCKKKFIGLNFYFAENNSDIFDLYLMSMCKNNIIANSTFSWWSAWLNNNEEKKVIAPKKWFGPDMGRTNTSDLYCDGWLKI